MVMRQFFSPSMCIYLRSQYLMLTFRYLLWSSCSVQPLVVPTGRKMVFLAIKSATVGESARNRWKSLHNNRSKAVLVLPDIFWGRASLLRRLWTVSGIVFKADILSTDYFFERQVSCTNLTLSVPVAATAPIRYRIWELEAIGAAEHNEPGLWAPWTSMNGWYKGHKLLKKNLNSTRAHGLG